MVNDNITILIRVYAINGFDTINLGLCKNVDQIFLKTIQHAISVDWDENFHYFMIDSLGEKWYIDPSTHPVPEIRKVMT